MDQHRRISLDRLSERDWVALCACRTTIHGRDHAEATDRFEAHIRETKRSPCPTPHKIRYRNQAIAERALRRIWDSGSPGNGRIPNRATRCQCGYWHLTSKAKKASVAGADSCN